MFCDLLNNRSPGIENREVFFYDFLDACKDEPLEHTKQWIQYQKMALLREVEDQGVAAARRSKI